MSKQVMCVLSDVREDIALLDIKDGKPIKDID